MRKSFIRFIASCSILAIVVTVSAAQGGLRDIAARGG